MTSAPSAPLGVGDQAPDLTLTDQFGGVFHLSEALAERAVLVVFYPFAFSGICTGELRDIRDDLGAFDNADVQVVAISCDSTFALRAWADREGYFFPLLSDFWPHGAVARAFGVLHERGFAVRGTFLVGRDGVIRWAQVNDPAERRDFAGYREAVAALGGDRADAVSARRHT